MKGRLPATVLVLIFATVCPGVGASAFATHTSRVRLEYTSPLPGSRYILPSSTIILKADHALSPTDARSVIVGISGTSTGSHSWHSRLSDDSRTMIFTPDVPFGPGEDVTVRFNTAVARMEGADQAGAFSFSIASHPVDNRALRDRLRPADFPPSVSVRQQARTNAPASTLGGGIQLPNISVSVSTPTSPGYLFLANLIWSNPIIPSLLVLKNDGTPVFARNLAANAYDFKPQPDGTLTYYDDGCQAFIVMDSTCTDIDTIACGNGYGTDPHDLQILPNGHALLLGVDNEIVDMSKLVAGGNQSATVVGYIIQELDAQRNVVFQWRSWDHYNITDAEHVDMGAVWIDYVHGNSLDVDTDGNILFSSRHMNEVDKIDRQTGAFIWRLGGNNNQFTFFNDSIGFSYQHAVRRIANGDITLFDNGDFHVPAFSRAVEYRLDEVNKTATLVWQFRDTPDVEGFAMGYVQRMENGNTLIGWGAGNPTVTEVGPGGTKLYEMSFDPGIYSYRAYRYEWTPAVTSAPIPPPPQTFSLAQNYPNPFNPTTTIRFSLAQESHVNLTVYNLIGQRIMTLVNDTREPGSYSVTLDGSHLASGVYLYRLEAGNSVSTRKLVLLR